MNKAQKLVDAIFAILILVVSFAALFNNGFLPGIIGIGISAALFIHFFSGKQEAKVKMISSKSILKNKVAKMILVILGILVAIFVITGIVDSIIYENKREQEQQQRWKQAKMRKQYFKNIEIVSTAIDFKGYYKNEPYLSIKIKNNGDKNLRDLTLQITYYDDEEYLIKRAYIKISEGILATEKRRFKIRLYAEEYPFSQREQIEYFEINPFSCQFTIKENLLLEQQ